MKTYKFSFFGRQQGAIGINYQIAQDYKANSLEEACTMLWVDYSPLRCVKLNGKDFEFNSKKLDHAETIKNYKGLGSLRK